MSAETTGLDFLDVRAPRRPPSARPTNGPPPVPPSRSGGEGRWDDPEPGTTRPAPAIVATVFLIGGEIMFFAGLIFAFWVLRLAAPFWPPPFQPRLPVVATGVNTLVLLASSAAMIAAGRALARGDRHALLRRLGLSAALGGTFLAVQGYEWARLLRFGLSASAGVYGATFYTLIGTHAAHVVVALVWLGVAWALAARGRFADGRTAPLRACALYWHFVVALWPVLYVSVYLR
jgi:heme/copper-type cytochrome/quinol oxidase subunit 3